MRGEPTLREMQARFYELVTAPEGVARALAARGERPAELERLVSSAPDGLSAVERLDIYANMYFYRILDVLRGDYPKLVAVVGDAAFHNLATDYLLACRPAHPSLRDAGARLPAFLRTHGLGLERPWLGDLAALERQRIEVFDARDADRLTMDRLRAIAPDDFAQLPIRLIPAHAHVRVAHAVEEVWQAIEEERAPGVPATHGGLLIVWRNEPDVHQRRVDEAELPLVKALVDGTSFGLICERLADGRSAEAATEIACRLLVGWATDGLIAA